MLRNVLNILTTFFYILTSFLAIAVPIDTNPKVISGEVEFSGLSTNEAIINQESLRAIVDYDQFNVLSGDMVRFIQPSEQAAILNRISGNVPSLINGSITANGQVFFVNPAGITFGENSVVRADLFLAAAGDISNEDFLNENLDFKLNGVIENLGLLQSNAGTYLLGKQILNSGKIESAKGVSLLASGDEIFLKNQGSSLMLRVSDNLLEPRENGIGVNNLGEVDGEEVMFSAGDAFADAIYHQGTARADKSVKLHSNGGNIKVSGEMEALSDDGGGISIFGDNISIENSTTRVISEALTGDDNLVQITAQDDLTLDGQGLALFGDTNLVISAKRFINNTGPNVFADGDADFRWSIALPKLIDESGPIHTFGGLKSNNPAKFGSVGDDSTPRNEYHFAFKPTITVTANNDSKIYGEFASELFEGVTFDESNLIDASFYGGVFSQDTIVTSVNQNGLALESDGGLTRADVGEYDISVSGIESPNGYDIRYVSGDLTVTPRAITLTASGQEKIYGDVLVLDDAAFSTTDLDGDSVLPNGELVDTVTLVSENEVDASTDSDAGTYADNISITPTATGAATLTGSNGFDQENYNISYATGDLTINRRAIELTASEQGKFYGDDLVLDDTAFSTTDLDGDSVLPNGELITNVSMQSATDKDESTTADVATYKKEIEILSPIAGTPGTGDGFRESNYVITYVPGDLTINRRDSIVIIDDQKRFAGQYLKIDQAAFILKEKLPNSELIEFINIGSLNGLANDPSSPRGYYPDEFVADKVIFGTNSFESSNYNLTFLAGDLEILPYPGLPAIFSEFDHPIWNSHHVGLFGLEQLDGPVPITDTILYRIDEVCDWGLIQDSKRNFIINEMGKANNRERTEELFKYHLNRE